MQVQEPAEENSGESTQVQEPAEEVTDEEAASETAVEDTSENTAPETYTVQQGDTLLKISRKIYGRDDQIDAICSLNGIEDSDHILVGQKLLLP